MSTNINPGNINGVNQTQSTQDAAFKDEHLSIADLNLMVQLERSEILDKQIREQIGIVHTKNEQLKALGEIQAKLANQRSNTAAVNENSWAFDNEKDPKEILLDNGYKIQLHAEKQSWSILDSNGNETKIWGDPHVNEGDREGDKQWDFQQDATFVLDDGTKITVKVDGLHRTDKNAYTDQLIITKGNQAIHVTGIAQNDPQVAGPNLDGAQLDASTPDGFVFQMGDQADDWLFQGEEITGDFKNVTLNQEAPGNRAVNDQEPNPDNINGILTQEEKDLLKELGIQIFNSDDTGVLTPDEITNLNNQIRNAKESLTSSSQLDQVTLQSLTGKYEQTNSLASQVLRQQYSNAKDIIRNIQ